MLLYYKSEGQCSSEGKRVTCMSDVFFCSYDSVLREFAELHIMIIQE